MGKRYVYWAFLAVVLAMTGTAVILSAKEGEVPAASGAEEAVAEGAAGGEEESGNVSMDFKDADIHNVLRILAYKGKVNIIAGPEVSGNVTIRLSNVPWEKALGVILRTYGFAYEREANIIRVTTLEKLKEEDLTTEVFALNYGKAEEVVESIQEMVTERGRVKFDSRMNLLIVTDVPTSVYRIGQVVERLDKKTPQVVIEAKIVETTLSDSEKLGINWTTAITATGAVRPMTYPFEIDGLIGNQLANYSAQSAAGTAAFPNADADDFTFGTLNFSQFQSVLEILKSRTDTNIISNPRITTLNNKEAKILVGEQIGIPVYERVEGSSTASMEITGYEYKELGIKLLVTPHINDNGDIVLDLLPSVTALLRYDALTDEINVPVFSTREAMTQVMIRDKETIVIGGLIKDQITDFEKKVPLLGDIPIIGRLFFTKKEDTIAKTDLLFFVTAHIVTDEEEQGT